MSAEPNRPGRRGAAAPRAYEGMQSDILTGRLDDAEPLVEGALAARYGVSRTPIREALRRLEHEGLVQRGNRGYEIRRYSPEELYDLYETRQLLEGFAARQAAGRHRPVDAGRLTEAHRRLTAVDDDGGADLRLAANRDFHTAVWQAAHNATLLEVLSRVYLSGVRHTTLTDLDRWRQARAEHQHILDAILAGDADRAETTMKAHLATGRDVAVRMQQQRERRR